MAAVNGATAYTAELSGPAGFIAIAKPVSVASAAFDLGPSDPSGEYSVTVIAGTTDGSSIASRAAGSAIAKVKVAILPPPGNLRLALDAGAITAQWKAVTGAASYTLHLFDAGGAPLSLDAQALTMTGETARVDAARAGLQPGSAYTVKVTAAAVGLPGWPASQSIVWLLAPSGVRVRYGSATRALALTWHGASGATGYAIALLDDAGAQVQPQPAFAVAGTTATSAPLSLAMGRRYAVCVAAKAGEQTGPSASADVTPFDLAAPAGLVCTVSGASIAAAWQPVTDATGYAVEIWSEDGRAVAPAPQIAVQGAAASIAGGGLQVRERYRVIVRATAENVDGAQSVARVRLAEVGTPTITSLQCVDATSTIALTWSAVADATDYTCTFVPQGKPEQAIDSVTVQAPGTQASLKAGAELAPALYEVRVRANADSVAGAWATQGVAKFPAPAVTVTPGVNSLVATWPQSTAPSPIWSS